MSANRFRGRRRDSDDEEDEDDLHIRRITFWVPAQGIEVQVLASYIKEYIDNTATIQTSKDPRGSSRTGFTISAANALTVNGVQDIISDSKDWDKETQSREFRKSPYGYQESDTYERRKRKGPTPATHNPVARRKRSPPAASSSSGAAANVPVTRGGTYQTQTTTAGPGTGRHDDNPPVQYATYRQADPYKPRPTNPDPDSYKQLEGWVERLNLNRDRDEPKQANQSARLGGNRHSKDDDDEDITPNPRHSERQEIGRKDIWRNL